MASPYAPPARELVQEGRTGFLATNLKKKPGYPYASLAPYAADAEGRPVFFFSGIAVHTRSLAEDARATLLVTRETAFADPRNTARVMLMGQVEPVPEDEIEAAQALYLAAWPDAEQFLEFADFGFQRMAVEDIHFVGGFGQAGWIAASDYTACPASSK